MANLTKYTEVEILSAIKLSFMFYGVTRNLLSAYFFLYGFDWLIRTMVSGAANYRYLLRKQKIVEALIIVSTAAETCKCIKAVEA